jgi:hypothetical protein
LVVHDVGKLPQDTANTRITIGLVDLFEMIDIEKGDNRVAPRRSRACGLPFFCNSPCAFADCTKGATLLGVRGPWAKKRRPSPCVARASPTCLITFDNCARDPRASWGIRRAELQTVWGENGRPRGIIFSAPRTSVRFCRMATLGEMATLGDTVAKFRSRSIVGAAARTNGKYGLTSITWRFLSRILRSPTGLGCGNAQNAGFANY